MTLDIVECEACAGTGVVEMTIHDTGHPDADCPCVCFECGGVGKVGADGRKLRPQEVV